MSGFSAASDFPEAQQTEPEREMAAKRAEIRP